MGALAVAETIIHQIHAITRRSIYNDGHTTKDDAPMKNASSNMICSIINILDAYVPLQYLLFIKEMQNAEDMSISRSLQMNGAILRDAMVQGAAEAARLIVHGFSREIYCSSS